MRARCSEVSEIAASSLIRPTISSPRDELCTGDSLLHLTHAFSNDEARADPKTRLLGDQYKFGAGGPANPKRPEPSNREQPKPVTSRQITGLTGSIDVRAANRLQELLNSLAYNPKKPPKF